ncbi:MAG: hypothetical protein JNL67_07850 [Planctomycetaceae bacterium]|nr:hypothetical protein [Planctomycetaceae bacterium]
MPPFLPHAKHQLPQLGPPSRVWLRRDFLASVVLCGLFGCSNPKKKDAPDPTSLLQKPTTSSHAVAVEFARVLVPTHRRRLLDEMWRASDQQAIPWATRMQLNKNLVRYAVIGQTLPAPLQSLLQPIPVAEDQLDQLQRQMLEAGILKPSVVVHDHTRLSMNYGQPRELDINGTKDTLHWVWQSEQGKSQHRYRQATPKVRVLVNRQINGTVQVKVEPLIGYGPLVPKLADALNQNTGDAPYLPGAAQQQVVIHEASGEASLRLGDTFVFGPSFDLSGRSETPRMGEVFFQHEGNTAGDWLVLLRVIESRFNDLFIS